jgi:proteasome lid subunit RPN8/RPN11
MAVSEGSERVGVLYGTVTRGRVNLVKLRLCEGESEEESAFTIATSELHRPWANQRSSALRTVGLLHTHPSGPAVPSPEDAVYLTLLPLLWVIVAPGERSAVEIRAFLGLESGFREVSIGDT